MQSDNVEISIVVPSHDRFDYVIELMNSIVNECKTYLQRTETIIIDDYSQKPYDFGLLNNKYSSYFGYGLKLLRNPVRKLYCLSQFWTDRKKNYDTVPAVSPPFLLVIFASLLKTLAFSIFASLMASRTSGFPL